MAEIAETAGVNKALLNYYYRSKEKMFQQVFEEDLHHFVTSVINLLNRDLPLDVKIYKVVDMYTSMLLNNPNLPLFILSEMRENPDKLAPVLLGSRSDAFHNLETQLDQEEAKGNIVKTSVPMFLMNLFSLTVFPFIVQPALHHIFHVTKEDFDDLVLERRRVIPRIIIDTLLPKT